MRTEERARRCTKFTDYLGSTSTLHCIEQKGKEQFPLRCSLRLVITTNDDRSAPVMSGERRYNVNEVSSELGLPWTAPLCTKTISRHCGP